MLTETVSSTAAVIERIALHDLHPPPNERISARRPTSTPSPASWSTP